MQITKLASTVIVLILLSASLFLLSECRDMGEDARYELEKAAENLSEFCSGFCGTAAVPLVVVAGSLARKQKRNDK